MFGAPHFGPAEDWLGMPVERVIPTASGAIVHYEMLYGPVRLGTPASQTPPEQSVADVLAQFDALAEKHRAKAKALPRPQCAENVGTGKNIRPCEHPPKRGSLYCGRHSKRKPSDDFEAAPNLADAPDSLPW